LPSTARKQAAAPSEGQAAEAFAPGPTVAADTGRHQPEQATTPTDSGTPTLGVAQDPARGTAPAGSVDHRGAHLGQPAGTREAATPGPPAGAPPGLPVLAHDLARPLAARVVARHSLDASRMTIELDPAELGPVEVALRLDDRGAAAATFVVERPETMALLQRDARVLTTALADAGFTLDPGNLSFQLRDGWQDERRQPDQRANRTEPRRPGAPAAVGSGPSAVLLGRNLYDLRV
jgi:flagellar hook-length control protein FliK